MTAEEEEKDKDEIDETDSGIVKLANQLIVEAAQRGRLGHPRRARRLEEPLSHPHPHRRRLRQVHGDPRPAPQRARAAPEDHGQARYLRAPQAAGWQDPLQVIEGHHRAARRHDPDGERQRRRCHAHPGGLEAAADREDGIQRDESQELQRRSWPSRTESASWSVRPARGRRRRSTRPSAPSTPRT